MPWGDTIQTTHQTNQTATPMSTQGRPQQTMTLDSPPQRRQSIRSAENRYGDSSANTAAKKAAPAYASSPRLAAPSRFAPGVAPRALLCACATAHRRAGTTHSRSKQRKRYPKGRSYSRSPTLNTQRQQTKQNQAATQADQSQKVGSRATNRPLTHTRVSRRANTHHTTPT